MTDRPCAVGAVITGVAKRELLQTYSDERQVVAKTLIDFDTKFSKLFSGKPASADDVDDGVDLKEFKDVFATGNLFAAGMSINYADSIVVGKDGSKGAVKSRPELASKLAVGERFFSAQVVNHASATADQLTTRIPYTGAFRILVFPGDVVKPQLMQRLEKFAAYLDSPESVVSKYTPSNLPRWSIIDPVTIRAACSSTYPVARAILTVLVGQTLLSALRLSCTTSRSRPSSTLTTTSVSTLMVLLVRLSSLTAQQNDAEVAFDWHLQTTGAMARRTRRTGSRRKRALWSSSGPINVSLHLTLVHRATSC